MDFRVIPAGDRAVTTTEWLTSRHAFSFGDHYDPSNTHFGVLLVNNDEIVAPGEGFVTHPHRESEIVTWVTSGSLVHQDSEGHAGIVYPGLAQRMSAGTGIEHSERNDRWAHRAQAGVAPVHYVQMWVMPDEPGLTPSYDQRDIDDELSPGRLVAIASGDPARDSAIRIANRSATLYAARFAAGSSIDLPAARHTHLFVTRGTLDLAGTRLDEGDAVRAGDLGGESLTARTDAEVLIWSMDRDLRDLMS
ncbi:pirin family protein [Gordonia hankookensis]|uniref:Pirin family protein n=1 Tax=Gordonia hankookensis TaxID=589403 RepID=A0ABR7WC86_9ACTN|nr:pirin-like bicupin family protein [Gordonia hankookensis]MBD1319963.1 pirin family protein [Gordonia hankookensis]